MADSSVHKIVSGGQTGVDRAALDVAIYLNIDHGGKCPKGRLAEDGTIPDSYQLTENDSSDYSVRTEQNVVESDGTLILHTGVVSGGTGLTRKLAADHKRACLTIQLTPDDVSAADVSCVQRWLSATNIGVLNIAGPRESSSPGISLLAERFLLAVFR
ncbi:MAG: putative molybdenum carrier protein [Planctomycetota bacterium]